MSVESSLLFGFLVVDKPTGLTSRQAVDLVKKHVRPAKIGHAGTLDPLATGVLVMCIGPATRLMQFVQQMTKTYVGEFRFGVTSATDDIESELIDVESAAPFSRADLEAAIPQFVGNIQQRPPEYSAIKVDGRRAYALSRAGKKVELEPRPVDVYEIEILEFNYPAVRLSVRCGSGTYIRSIGRDLGQALGSGAVMTALRRESIGDFDLSAAVDPESLSFDTIEAKISSPLLAFSAELHISFNSAQIQRLQNGGMYSSEELGISNELERYVAVDADGNALAVLSKHRSGNFKPEMNFVKYYD